MVIIFAVTCTSLYKLCTCHDNESCGSLSSAVVWDTRSRARRSVKNTRNNRTSDGTVISRSTQQQLHEVFSKQHVDGIHDAPRKGLAPRTSHCPGTALALPWHCPGTALALPWHCPGTALALPWHCPGTALALPWHCPGTALALSWVTLSMSLPCPRHCPAPGTARPWHCPGTALALPGPGTARPWHCPRPGPGTALALTLAWHWHCPDSAWPRLPACSASTLV